MSRMEKCSQILELAIMMQNSYCGISLDDIMENFEVSKRTAQRMKSVIEDNFTFRFEEVENYSTRKKHWRLKKGTVNCLIGITSEEIGVLERATDFLLNEKDKKVLSLLLEKLKFQVKHLT